MGERAAGVAVSMITVSVSEQVQASRQWYLIGGSQDAVLASVKILIALVKAAALVDDSLYGGARRHTMLVGMEACASAG